MPDYAELIERLEKATGPDRELDGEIWCAIEQVVASCWPHWTEQQRNDLPPYYSRSVDTALMLVPEGWRLTHLSQVDPTTDHPQQPQAEVTPHLSNDAGWKHGTQKGNGARLAIAVVIACLRARAAGEK